MGILQVTVVCASQIVLLSSVAASSAALNTSTSPTATSVPQSTCASDHDCSLAGACTAGTCVCDAGWTGTHCSTLSLEPAEPGSGIDAWSNGTSSWGGVAVADPDRAGLYHFFYSRFTGGCGLLCWVNVSECVRAVGPTPAGPFTDAAVVFGVFCYNPTIRRTPDGTFVLFHIGQDDPGRALNCSSANETCPSNWPPAVPSDGRQFLTYASASHPAGPWTPLGRAAFAGAGHGWLGWVSNPSVHFFANGTALLAFRSKVMPDADNAPGANGSSAACVSPSSTCGLPVGEEVIGLASAPHWSGPYSLLVPSPIVVGHEDPHVWADQRGNLHLLSHGSTNLWFTTPDSLGNWTLANGAAYTFDFSWSNGTQAVALRRERPQLFFSNDGMMTPLVFTTGVTIQGTPLPEQSLTLAQNVRR
jgi:hypothetical protein